MVAIFHKIVSFFLAVIVLFASFSFTVNKHICGGEVVNTTLFVSADTCGMNMNVCEKDTINKKETSIQKEPCCQNITKVIQGNDNNQQAQQVNLSFPQVQFLQAFVVSFVLKYQEITSISNYVHYSPPLVVTNVQTLFQVFRI